MIPAPNEYASAPINARRRSLGLPRLQGGVTWPVLLLYPQHGQSDLIQQFRHGDMVAEHLARAFPEEGPPAPWDETFEYRYGYEITGSRIFQERS